MLHNLVVSAKPSHKNYCELIAVMNKRQNPKPSVIVGRCKFNKRDRKPGECIPFYITELKYLSQHCDFGLGLHNMIRDRLVCGVRSTKIWQRLLPETDLSFEGALKIACAMERAEKNGCEIEEGMADIEKSEGSLKKLQGRWKEIDEKRYRKEQEYFWCEDNHFQTQCHFKNVTCIIVV